jgi:hypothetical protein
LCDPSKKVVDLPRDLNKKMFIRQEKRFYATCHQCFGFKNNFAEKFGEKMAKIFKPKYS